MKSAIHWFEIPVTDIDKAAAFYEAMLGYTLRRETFMGNPHAMFAAEDPGTSGTLLVDAKRTPSSVGTIVYLAAPDGVAPCLARAAKAGARVIQPRTSLGEVGEIGLIEDLDGNRVGLHAETKAK
jgi:uncharacterized protein